jgi:hypothetical protein
MESTQGSYLLKERARVSHNRMGCPTHYFAESVQKSEMDLATVAPASDDAVDSDPVEFVHCESIASRRHVAFRADPRF